MTFSVTLQKSGHRFTCDPEQNVLAAGLKAGFMLPYNCRSGLCRTCKSRLVEGHITYGNRPLNNYLSERDVGEGYVLLCQAHPASDLVVDAHELLDLTLVQPIKLKCRVIELTKATPDVMLVRLRLPMNEHLRYEAGQHLSILLPGGLRRDYSIANACGAAGVTEVELHVRHLPGGVFTDRLFTDMKLRALLDIELPLGSFYVRKGSDKPLVILATGTGFAPVKAMMESALSQGLNDRRPIHFFWGGRTREDLYMAKLAEDWARKVNVRFTPVLSQPTSGCDWAGLVGYVQDYLLAHHPDLSGYEVYACGSPRMVDGARELAIERGRLDPDAFFADEFLTAADQAVALIQERL